MVDSELDELFSEAAAASAEETAQARTPDLLGAIRDKAGEVDKLDQKITELEAQIEVHKERKNAILQRELIDLFTTARMADTTIDGVYYSVDEYVKAAVPPDQRDAGHDWLEGEGFGDLIKYTVTAEFGKDQSDDVQLVRSVLNALGVYGVTDDGIQQVVNLLTSHQARLREAKANDYTVPCAVKTDRTVPWARLTSWYKEWREGNSVSDYVKGVLGVVEYRYVKMQRAGETKRKKK